MTDSLFSQFWPVLQLLGLWMFPLSVAALVKVFDIICKDFLFSRLKWFPIDVCLLPFFISFSLDMQMSAWINRAFSSTKIAPCVGRLADSLPLVWAKKFWHVWCPGNNGIDVQFSWLVPVCLKRNPPSENSVGNCEVDRSLANSMYPGWLSKER